MKLPTYDVGGLGVSDVEIRVVQSVMYAETVAVSVRLRVTDAASGYGTAYVYTEYHLATDIIAEIPGVVRDTVRRTLLRAFEHEIDEWLTEDGVRLTNPHAGDTR